MAGGLGVRLSGPRTYDRDVSYEPWLNEHGRDPVAGDVPAGLKLYIAAMLIAVLCLTTIVLALSL